MFNLFPGKKLAAVPETKSRSTFDYQINDSTTPDLRASVLVPAVANKLRYTVRGLINNPKGEKDRMAMKCFITIAKSIDYIQTKAKYPINKWATSSNLQIIPFSGKMFNAYYDRSALKFFYDLDPDSMKVVYAANSTDIIAHELGHGLLDAMRPDLWNTQALEIWSFHEAFGDINAIAHIMQYDVVLNRAITETGGDLRKSNVISRLAEEFGKAIYSAEKGEGGLNPLFLRDASIPYLYTNPNDLPKNGRADQVIAECHSFGRIFASAWYEMMVRFYENEITHGKATIDALKIARDIAFMILVQAIPNAPRTTRFYAGMAKAMCAVAKMKDLKYYEITRQVFLDRKILTPEVKFLSSTDWFDVRNKIQGDDKIVKGHNLSVVRLARQKTLKLSDYSSGMVSSLSANGHDLSELELEIPVDSYYEFDIEGNLVEEITPSIDECIEDARLCVSLIAMKSDLGYSHKSSWNATDGKLIRNLIYCGCR